MNYLDSLLNAVNQAQEAVLQCLKSKEAKTVVKEKGSDLTRRVDLIAEEKIEESLKNEGFQAYLISEETSLKIIGEKTKPELIIVIDPLDGTRNFINSIPFYSISIAVGKVKNEESHLNNLIIGVVKDVLRGDLFYAIKGEGAYYNNEKIEEKIFDSSDKPLISLYSYGETPSLTRVLSLLKKFKIRVLGSLALELCYTALGRLDGVIDARGKARIVDFAAGKIIVEEAGGVISSLNGKPIEASLKDVRECFDLIAAKNPFFHKILIEALKE